MVSTYVMDKGLLVEGAQGAYSWNPWTSGKTYLEVKPFWRDQEVRSQDRRLTQKTNGAEFSIFHDNTDFPRNPSRGDSFRVRYTKDWGMLDSNNPYVQEHVDLIRAIQGNKPINETKDVTDSTLTAIMGREAAYSGREITWEKAMASKQVLAPSRYAWDADPPVKPDAGGNYPAAMPGITPFA